MLMLLIATAILCALIILINKQQNEKTENQNLIHAIHLFLATMSIIIGVLVWLSTIAPPTPETPTVSSETGITFLLSSVVLGGFSLWFALSERVRLVFQNGIVRSDGKMRRYSAYSPVHTTAVLLAIFASLNVIGNFILAGGTSGLAESFNETGIAASDLLLNMVIYVAMALAGVGLFVRRDIARTLRRLGFYLPQKETMLNWLGTASKHIIIGILVGFGLFWVQAGLAIVWQLTASPESLAEQTAATEAIFAALGGSLWLGFLVALTAGVGEELLFRGALQPVFGNVLTSLFFVVLHSQYLFTPATLIILLVSLIFGLLRDRYTTGAAMVAHFIYNFTPFILLHFATQFGIPI